MQSVVQFFSSVPPRLCTTCNKEMEELADCYPETCPDCDPDHVYYPLHREPESDRSKKSRGA